MAWSRWLAPGTWVAMNALRAFAVLLPLAATAACSNDRGDGSVMVTVGRGLGADELPVAGARLLVHDPAGMVAAEASTSADGSVRLVVPPGGMVTAVWDDGTLDTATAVDGIDLIDFVRYEEPQPATRFIDVIPPPVPQGADRIWINVDCGGFASVAVDEVPTEPIRLDVDCDVVDVLVAAIASDGAERLPIAFAVATGVDVTAGTVSMTAWTPPVTMDVTIADMPDADSSELGLWQLGGAGVFSLPGVAVDETGDDVVRQLRFAAGLGDRGRVELFTSSDRDGATEFRWLNLGFDPLPTSLSIDAAESLMPVIAVNSNTQGSVSWDAGGVAADTVQAWFDYTPNGGSGGQWRFTAPPDLGAIQMPALPADLSNRLPVVGSVRLSWFMVLEADYMDGYGSTWDRAALPAEYTERHYSLLDSPSFAARGGSTPAAGPASVVRCDPTSAASP
jgi:hypothetical protein